MSILTIDPLKWDSELFGFKVGKHRLTVENEIDTFLLNAKREGYRLVYLFSKSPNISHSKINLVDTKVTFLKSIKRYHHLDVKSNSTVSSLNTAEGRTNLELNLHTVEFNSKHHNYGQLLKLAYNSGEYSRFKLDTQFKQGTFQKLYKIWIDKSISRDIASYTRVFIHDDQIVGFITLNTENTRVARIGLIAVHPNYRGQKIASKMLQDCELLCNIENQNTLSVVSQKNNIAASKLYLKTGFIIQSEIYTYHVWL
jgi:dTDP-4-amino-4,6-dideoxy-D-galactose acyltransferase